MNFKKNIIMLTWSEVIFFILTVTYTYSKSRQPTLAASFRLRRKALLKSNLLIIINKNVQRLEVNGANDAINNLSRVFSVDEFKL